MNKLVVSGVDLDLKEEQAISITHSLAGIKDPSKRIRSYSKRFKLVGTTKNLKFFKEYIMLSWVRNDNIVSDISFDPSVSLECSYFIDEGLRFKGFIKLLDIEIDNGVITLNVNMYSDVSNLFQEWDDLMLNELDWSMYNHDLFEDLMEFSFDTKVMVNGSYVNNFSGANPDGFGYIYGLIDYGLSADQLNYVDNQLFPLIYTREAFIKSFEYLGYTVNSSFIDSQDFKDNIIGWGGGTSPALPDTLVNGLEIEADFNASYSNTKNAQIVSVPTFDPTVSSISNYKVINFKSSESSFSEVVSTDSLGQLSNGIVTAGASATYTINVSLNALMTNTASTDANLGGVKTEAHLYLVKSNNKTLIDSYGYIGNGSLPNWTINKDVELYLNTNDDYYFQIVHISSAVITSTGTYGTLTSGIDVNNTFDFNSLCTASEVVTGSTVYLSNYVPKMKVVDFIKGIITHFNLYISDPDINGVIDIEPMPDYYEDSTNYDEWTYKQDLSKKQIITPLATKQPNSLIFKFKQDKDFLREDYYNNTGEHYGDYTHNNNLSYGASSQNYTLPYTLTPLHELDNGLVIPRVVKIENGVVKPFKGSTRMYVYGGMKSGNFNIVDKWGTSFAKTSYPVLSNLDNINTPTKDIAFSTPIEVYYNATSYTTNTAFKRFYSLLVNELNSIDSKMLSSYFRLNPSDVNENFMRRVKMINGVLYRFNLLSDYNLNKDDSYKVELVKILDVQSVGESTVVQAPLVKSANTTNGQNVVIANKNVTVVGNEKMIVIDDTATSKINVDIGSLPIGKEVTIFSKTTESVVIEPLSGELINGSSEVVLNNVNSFIKIIYTGSEYLIISE